MTSKALITNDKSPLSQRIAEFIRTADNKFSLEKAFLFGSTAKGTRHLESDVDLIIVSRNFKDLTVLDRVGKLLELWPYIEELEILAYTPKEFNDVKHRVLVKKILFYAIDLTSKKPMKTKPKTTKQKAPALAY